MDKKISSNRKNVLIDRLLCDMWCILKHCIGHKLQQVVDSNCNVPSVRNAPLDLGNGENEILRNDLPQLQLRKTGVAAGAFKKMISFSRKYRLARQMMVRMGDSPSTAMDILRGIRSGGRNGWQNS